MKAIKVALIVTTAIVTCIGAGAAYYIKSGIPVKSFAELEVKGLLGEITILRDHMGVPHIYGDHSTDILFAAGYTQMQDRLFQFELRRRAGSGELSELFGKTMLNADLYARKSSYSKAQVKAMMARMKLDHREHFLAMLAGINLYIDQIQANPGKFLPLEFKTLGIPVRHYTEADIIAAISVTGRLYGAAGGNEVKNLKFLTEMIEKHGPQVGKMIFDDVLVLNDPDAYAFAEEGSEVYVKIPREFQETKNEVGGSFKNTADSMIEQSTAYKNALSKFGLSEGASRTIVVGPERSASGNVLMMQATADGHEVHLSGDGFEAAGLAMVPSGFPTMGRTPDFGWLITTSERDTVDTYVEKLNPNNKYQYWYVGAWRDMDVRTEIIKIAGEEPLEVKVAHTVHGPVFGWNEESNIAYSKRWAVWEAEVDAWGTLLEFARTKTKEGFEEIILNSTQASVNITIGDKYGHIETWHSGHKPNRLANVDPRLPIPGTGEYEWLAFIKPEQWPNLENPDRGYIVVWNNKPTSDAIYGDAGRWGKHYRTYLPLSLLKSDESITLDDMRNFNKIISRSWGSVDLNVTSSEFFEPFWKEAVLEADDPRITKAVAILIDWDGLYLDSDNDGKYDHAGMPLFQTWLSAARDVIFEDELGEWRYGFEDHNYIKYGSSLVLRALEGQDAGLPTKWDFLNGKSRNEVVRIILIETIERMEKKFGKNMAAWQQPIYWRYMGQKALSSPEKGKLPVRNTEHIRATHYTGAAVDLGYIDNAVPHNGAPNWMALMEISSDAPKIESVIPSGGQSWFINRWYRASRHLNDQTNRHVNFNLKTIEMDRNKIEDVLESTLLLKPAR
ncbi:MAG: penicillin acylase family protein [Robiginitomaculum sp.]